MQTAVGPKCHWHLSRGTKTPLKSEKMIVRGSTFVLSVLCSWWVPSTLYKLPSRPEHRRTLHLDDRETTSELPVAAGRVKRVAIIGGGTSGLAALKTFVHDIPKPDGQRWEIELFEQRDDLGGVWLVLRFDLPRLGTHWHVHQCRLEDDSSARYPHLPETPLYPQLRTNTPAPTRDYKFLHLPTEC